MIRSLFIYIFFLFGTILSAQEKEGWELFAHAQFEEIFVKEFYSFERILKPDSSILDLEGSEITLQGYYVPIANPEGSIIISKTPYASCFFCGAAGQETVAEIFTSRPVNGRFETDEKLKFKGIFTVNTEDWEKLSFRLEKAELIEN